MQYALHYIHPLLLKTPISLFLMSCRLACSQRRPARLFPQPNERGAEDSSRMPCACLPVHHATSLGLAFNYWRYRRSIDLLPFRLPKGQTASYSRAQVTVAATAGSSSSSSGSMTPSLVRRLLPAPPMPQPRNLAAAGGPRPMRSIPFRLRRFLQHGSRRTSLKEGSR